VTMGPVEIFVFSFPDNKFNGKGAPALARLVETGLIRVIDLLFITKDDKGDVASIELSGVDEDVRVAFEPLIEALTGLISDEDVEDLAEDLPSNSSAAILLIEHTWAGEFADALADSGAVLVSAIRIPREVVEEVEAIRAAG
jgi:hypothetical protein